MVVLKTPAEMAQDAAFRFRNLRKAKKISIKELSEKSGVPYSTVRRFENTGEIGFVSFVKLVSTIDEDDEITGLFQRRIPTSIEEIIYENSR